MVRRPRRPHAGRAQPGHRRGDRPRRACRDRRPRPRRHRRREGLPDLAPHPGDRARQDPAPRRSADARARRRHRPPAHPGTRQAAARGENGNTRRRRHHRVVCRRRPARVWPHRAGTQPRRHADGDQGPGRPGRRLHAVELPHQPGRAQGRGGARHRLLHPGQGRRGDARGAGRAGARLRRCRRAGRRDRAGVWQTRRRSPAT